MRKGICFIVGAGDITPRGLKPGPDDLLLAADGGFAALMALGLTPRALVGDMDSYSGSTRGVPTLRFPVRKNHTDLSLAIRLGMRAGYRRFRLFGASGGPREDHFLAALQLMTGLAVRGLQLRLVAPHFDIDVVKNGRLLLSTRPGSTLSVLSATPKSNGVSLLGTAYSAIGLTLNNTFPLGVSNTALSSRAVVGVKKGTLLIYRQVD